MTSLMQNITETVNELELLRQERMVLMNAPQSVAKELFAVLRPTARVTFETQERFQFDGRGIPTEETTMLYVHVSDGQYCDTAMGETWDESVATALDRYRSWKEFQQFKAARQVA
jgi:hypothetical protein